MGRARGKLGVVVVERFCHVILLLLLLVLLEEEEGWRRVEALSVLAKSELVMCEQYGGSPTPSTPTCKNMMVTTITVTNKDGEAAGELRFTQWKCRASNGTELNVRYGIKIVVTKGQTWLFYPIYYQRHFNYAPFEELLYMKEGDCQDDVQQRDVSCRWAYVGNVRVQDSQVCYPPPPHHRALPHTIYYTL
uniref:Generative cell specific-1/HAP2 domain-containing protein n=1 Tax=Physcomitrium patens TaxID=3218 RepID=A0A2K1IEZ0_PHYPA|nr:hypothetical protein PHYPA_029992 [Physcomitrium patens]